MKKIETSALIGLGALGILFGRKMPGVKVIADAERVARYSAQPVVCNGKECHFDYVTPEQGQPVDPAGRLAGKGLVRPSLRAQYLPDDPGRSRTQQGARHRLLPRQPDRHRHLPLPGQRAVERHQLLEPNARRPQCNGWIGFVGERQPHPGVV